MFNSCVLSGVVLTEPELRRYEDAADAVFELGITIGPFMAGYITVRCSQNLAAVAAKSLHQGDRVALVGVIGRYEDETEKSKQPRELLFLAHDMELVRGDSPVLGMTGSGKAPKP